MDSLSSMRMAERAGGEEARLSAASQRFPIAMDDPLSPTLSPSDGEREKPPADFDPTNDFGMVRQEKARNTEGESPSRLNMNDNTKT